MVSLVPAPDYFWNVHTEVLTMHFGWTFEMKLLQQKLGHLLILV